MMFSGLPRAVGIGACGLLMALLTLSGCGASCKCGMPPPPPVPEGAYPSQACLDKANGLLAMMTLDEKLAQTIQLERLQVTPAQIAEFGIGSVFSQGGSGPGGKTPAEWADMMDGFQVNGALQSRLRIPVFYGIDIVHGAATVSGATVFPHNVALGATRNLDLVEQIARATAVESSAAGSNYPLSPVLAVARDERWGRTYESFGETTELATTMGVAMVKGLQLTTDGRPSGILACAKHYIGDGGTAMGATGADTAGDETALRHMHLPPYLAAVDAHVGSIMVSYNSWQGTRMHINRTMITDVLKGQMNFGGMVIADYDGCYQVGLDNHDGLGACLNSGIDMFMLFAEGGAGRTILADTLNNLRSLVTQRIVSQARIDDAVRRIVAVKCELGLFESAGPIDRALAAEVGSTEHRALAREAVRESVVVLKNDGNLLPLSRAAAGIAVAGNSADNTGNQCSGWTLTWMGNPGNVVPGATSLRAAFESVVGADHVAYSLDGSNVAGASVGVAVIGEVPYSEGYGDANPSGRLYKDLVIPEAQAAVVRALKQAGLPTVVVLIAGRPLILDPILPYADAIVTAWLPGSEGAGVTDVLFGDAHPTGKLPHSWPRSMAQIPINQGDASYDPLWPFGYGLTY